MADASFTVVVDSVAATVVFAVTVVFDATSATVVGTWVVTTAGVTQATDGSSLPAEALKDVF